MKIVLDHKVSCEVPDQERLEDFLAEKGLDVLSSYAIVSNNDEKTGTVHYWGSDFNPDAPFFATLPDWFSDAPLRHKMIIQKLAEWSHCDEYTAYCNIMEIQTPEEMYSDLQQALGLLEAGCVSDAMDNIKSVIKAMKQWK